MRKFQVPTAVAKPTAITTNNQTQKIPQTACTFASTQSQFVCLYNKKGPKKKKTYIDGSLVIAGDKIVLKDASSNLQVASVRPTSKILSTITIGSQIEIGPYEVEILHISTSLKSNVNNISSSSSTDNSRSCGTEPAKKTFTANTLKRPVFKSLLVNRPSDQKKSVITAPTKRSISPPPLLKPDSAKTWVMPPKADMGQQSSFGGGGGGGASGLKRARIPPGDVKDPIASDTSDPGLKSLLRVMQPHQKEAVRFMWSSAVSSSLNVSSSSERFSSNESGGCILADSMGLGKTLSTIAFIYACVHHRLTSKVVVVVPSSLVENWRNEFSKWLRHFLSPHVNSADKKVLIAAASEKKKTKTTKSKASKKKKTINGDHENEDDDDMAADKEVGGVESGVVEFTKFKAPVLIISYDGFRKYSDMLNSEANVDMIVCDEGHRLKCAQGSKTFSSLQDSPAFFKLLLTGTPVQNDLLELHAMVNFVKPGLLGKLGQFKREFSDCINAGRDLQSSEDEKGYGQLKANELRELLQSVILRRTAEVLVKSLPPRKELVVFCRLCSRQQQVYQSILKSSGYGTSPLDTNSTSISNDDGDDLIDSDEEEELDDFDTRQGDVVPNDCSKVVAGGDKRDALGSIHALRMVCNHPMLLDKQDRCPATVDVTASSKLQFLQSLLSHLINIDDLPSSSSSSESSFKRPRVSSEVERIVIVSNFTSTLNVISTMASINQWKCLRIDGSTPTDQRQSLVDRFNRRSETDDAYIFLLSSHAGGVGLNLVGASRLVLFDSDWNPAIDLQTMGRIWRQGQKRPVFIYRLLCTGTLEEKMYQRQIAKGELSCAVEVNNNNKAADEDADDHTNDNQADDYDVRHFEQDDIRDLFSYDPAVRQCDTFECMRGKWTSDGTKQALMQDKLLGDVVHSLDNGSILHSSHSECCKVSFVHLHNE